jgi:hypothetical protein
MPMEQNEAYSITSSARSSTAGGISTPSCYELFSKIAAYLCR